MWTPEKIEQFCKDFGFKPVSTKAEIKELPNLLSPDEQLLGLLEGFLKDIHGRNVNGQGIVIATSKRVIFFRKSFIGTITKEETSLSKVSAVSYRKGILVGSISIISASNDSIVDNCDKKMAEKFIGILSDLISKSQSAPNQKLDYIHDDPMLKLEKLFELKQKGILSEDEFNQQKAKLLNM